MARVADHSVRYCNEARGECAPCVEKMAAETRERDPLAVLCFGFRAAFKSRWYFEAPASLRVAGERW